MAILTKQNVARDAVCPRPGRQIVLRTEGLTKSFGGQLLLDNVRLILRDGDVVLLRGENGSGKTTLLNILTGNLEPDAGTIHYFPESNSHPCSFPPPIARSMNPFDRFSPERLARKGIGRTWQHHRLFGNQSLRDNIAIGVPFQPGEHPLLALFAPSRCARREADICQQADNMLVDLGLGGRGDSSADRVSLGQSKRVAIARAVAAGAHVLFLDEPLAGLDKQGIVDVIALLRLLVKNHGITLVIVEHYFNQHHLRDFITSHWTLMDGALTQESGVADELGSCHEGGAWFDLLAVGTHPAPPEHLPGGAILTRFRLPGRFQPHPLLSIDRLVVSRGTRTVVGLDEGGEEAGFNLVLNTGEIAVLQAPNGWGKTTLFEALAGIIPISSGEVRLDGTVISTLPNWQRPRRGLHLNTCGSPYFNHLRLSELARLSGYHWNGDAPLPENRLIGSASGGECRRISLITFLHRPSLRVALLDEPFLGFDERSSREFADRIKNSSAEAMLIAEPHRS